MSLLDRIFPWLGHGRYLESPDALVDQEVAPLRVDATGALVVTTVNDAIVSFTQASSTGTTGNSRSSAGILGALYAASLTGTTYYLQLFDISTAPPAGGAAPKHVFPLVAGGLVSVEALGGLSFDVGITWAISSTATTYTAVAGNPAHVIAKHRGPA